MNIKYDKKKSMSKTSDKALIKGSKIPFSYFFDYIKAGYTISDFLSSYPWVKKKDLLKKLEELEEKAVSSSYAL